MRGTDRQRGKSILKKKKVRERKIYRARDNPHSGGVVFPLL